MGTPYGRIRLLCGPYNNGMDYPTAYMIVKWVAAVQVKLVRCGHCRSAMLPTHGKAGGRLRPRGLIRVRGKTGND